MIKTSKSTSGTSFHFDTVTTTKNMLESVLGEIDYSGDYEDKVQNEWNMELETGEVFTVYDWKEYRPYSNDDVIEWHIGGHDRIVTSQAKQLIEEKIKNG